MQPMKALIKYELSQLYSKYWIYLAAIIAAGFGFVIGQGASITMGLEVFKNGTYLTALMISFLSLFGIFFAGLLAPMIYFRESDHNFDLIFNALPLSNKQILTSKIFNISLYSVMFNLLLILGFMIGQSLMPISSKYTSYHTLNYLMPMLIFTIPNTLFCVVVLSFVAHKFHNKMMAYVSALLLYILYMFTLIFSGSPLMAKGMPPSETAVLFTSLFDPFGMSAFFKHTAHWSVELRNDSILLPQGILLLNRLLYAGVILILIWTMYRKPTLISNNQNKKLSQDKYPISKNNVHEVNENYKTVVINSSTHRHFQTLLSTTKIDLIHTVKSIPFIMICLGLLFYMSMELYGAIEKGVRMPQFYASSGLLASMIIKEFDTLCMIAILFYANEIYWRSKSSNFHLVEDATWAKKSVIFASKWVTLIILIFIFTILSVLLSLTFQVAYGYLVFDWKAYGGIFIFTSLYMIAIAGLALLVQRLVPNKYAALAVSAIVIGFVSSSMGNKVLEHPLLEGLMPFEGKYSSMNGFGPYLSYYFYRYSYAILLIIIITMLTFILSTEDNINRRFDLSFFTKSKTSILGISLCSILLFVVSKNISNQYIKKDKELSFYKAAKYEKNHRRFAGKIQPVVSGVVTSIDLYPSQNKYNIVGKYILKNKSSVSIDSILISFSDDMKIVNANLNGKKISMHDGIYFHPMSPGDSTVLHFTINYEWHAANGHSNVNNIIENGSFSRISRFFPSIGYQSDYEISDEDKRKEYHLGEATLIKKWDAPKTNIDDFINLDMTITTDTSQLAIGVGELVEKTKIGNRNKFRYITPSPIPFRFGISSAKYTVVTQSYKGKNIEIYYHKNHHENVSHLLKNIKLTLDYCESNFGPYPFNTIRFAEVSSFTKGFAATAYPASVFMPEDMLFHANINADRKQDVINEIAGHELAHMWWGNNQIAPDNREGEAFLTETLAMYTEMMLVKKMHGEKRVLNNVVMFNNMYLNERGYTTERPLCQVHTQDTHLSYYKGLVSMYQLSQLIGEEKVNQALRSFLQLHKYPAPRPTSTDLLNEFYKVTPIKSHYKIDELFKGIVPYKMEIKKDVLEIKQKL